MLLGVNDNHEIVAVGEITTGLTVIEIENGTFEGVNPMLFKIRIGENWQMICPSVLVQSWEVGKSYSAGDVIAYGGTLYETIQAHTSQIDWEPDIVPALFKSTLPEGVIGEWKQPAGGHDAYNIGDLVWFGSPDKVYKSKINANVWSPTGYPAGWELQ